MANIESELTCIICLELLNEPHHYPCGHNFCLRCINELRGRQNYHCPECRKLCPDERHIVRDFRLSNVIEAYRRSGQYTQCLRLPSAPGWPGRQDLGVLLVIALLLFISVYTSMRLQRTEQALKDSQMFSDSTFAQPADFLQEEQPSEDFFKTQSDHIDEEAASSGPLFLLLAPLRWLWLLVWAVLMCVWWCVWCVWWLISSVLWLVFQCVWLVYECVRFVFVSIWCFFSFCICFVCNLLMQSFSIFVYICGLASITVFSLRYLVPESNI